MRGIDSGGEGHKTRRCRRATYLESNATKFEHMLRAQCVVCTRKRFDKEECSISNADFWRGCTVTLQFQSFGVVTGYCPRVSSDFPRWCEMVVFAN